LSKAATFSSSVPLAGPFTKGLRVPLTSICTDIQRDGFDVESISLTGADHMRWAYLVGCDSGRSFIRKRASFDFPGTELLSPFYQAVAQIDHPYLVVIASS
jgi:2-polyprenyl-6-methoxyphenol hydroxylase-like FAD-dependent oxidoreductase